MHFCFERSYIIYFIVFLALYSEDLVLSEPNYYFLILDLFFQIELFVYFHYFHENILPFCDVNFDSISGFL